MPPRSGIALMRRSGSGSVSYRRGSRPGAGRAVRGHGAGGGQADLHGRGYSAPAQVQACIDGRTVQLSDGRTVRLAGIEVSQPDEPIVGANTPSSRWNIWCSVAHPDAARPGNRPATAGLWLWWRCHPHHPASRPAQAAGAGHARVAANIGDFACAASLLAAEKAARAGGPWPLGQPVLCDAKCRGSRGGSRGSGSFRRG